MKTSIAIGLLVVAASSSASAETVCRQINRKADKDMRWAQGGMSRDTDEAVLGINIVAYRLAANASKDEWIVAGVNDVAIIDGERKLAWADFGKMDHDIIACSEKAAMTKPVSGSADVAAKKWGKTEAVIDACAGLDDGADACVRAAAAMTFDPVPSIKACRGILSSNSYRNKCVASVLKAKFPATGSIVACTLMSEYDNDREQCTASIPRFRADASSPIKGCSQIVQTPSQRIKCVGEISMFPYDAQETLKSTTLLSPDSNERLEYLSIIKSSLTDISSGLRACAKRGGASEIKKCVKLISTPDE